jgi:elongation factor P
MNAMDLKAGTLFKTEGKFYVVVECQKVQQPRLAAFMRAKVKNLENGAVKEENFKPNQNFEDVEVVKRFMKFSYADGDLYYFTEEETWENECVQKTMAVEALKYDNETDPIIYTFEYINGKLVRVIPPTFVVLRVTQTDPAIAGDTARSALKNATLESGLIIKVQMFIKTGDRVKVDTRTGEYVERV